MLCRSELWSVEIILRLTNLLNSVFDDKPGSLSSDVHFLQNMVWTKMMKTRQFVIVSEVRRSRLRYALLGWYPMTLRSVANQMFRAQLTEHDTVDVHVRTCFRILQLDPCEKRQIQIWGYKEGCKSKGHHRV